MITGADVIAERTRRKLSRSKFAELVGLTPTKVANIERGRAPRPDELALLAPHVSSLPPVESTVILLDEDEEVIFIDLTDPAPSRGATPAPSAPVATVGDVSPASHIPAVAPTLPPLHGDPVPVTVVNEVVATPTTTAPHLPGPVGVAALYVDGRRRLSNSEIQTFKHCRRRWWLSWYRGLRLKLEPQTGPLPLGTRVHLALAAYYVPVGQSPVDPREALEKVLAEDEVAVLMATADRETSDAATVMIEFKKDADMARAMIEGYIQWLAETGADAGYRVIAPEQVLTAVLRTPDGYPDVMLAGRLDLRLQREHDGAVLFLDHKTTGNMDQLIRMLIWDEQLKQYHLLEAANRPAGEPPVVGALYNMLRKVKRSVTAKPPFYQRIEVHHNVDELGRFKARLLGQAAAITGVENALNDGMDHQKIVYPTPSSRCLWGCEFSAVCPQFDDGSRAEDFIADHYVHVNPLDRYDDKIKGDEINV